jgi:Family of unknown function (DUF6491)
MLRIGILASAALMLASCASTEAQTAAAGDRDCFQSASVRGFDVIDRSTVEVSVGASRRYLLTTNWQTSNLDFSEHIAIRSATGYICTGNGLGVEIVGGEPRRTYPIQSIARAPDPAPQS